MTPVDLNKKDLWPKMAVERQFQKILDRGPVLGEPATFVYLFEAQNVASFARAAVENTTNHLLDALWDNQYAETLVLMLWGEDATVCDYMDETLENPDELVHCAYTFGLNL